MPWKSRKSTSKKHSGKVERGKQNIIVGYYTNTEKRGSQRMPLKTNKPVSKTLNIKKYKRKTLMNLGQTMWFQTPKSQSKNK